MDIDHTEADAAEYLGFYYFILAAPSQSSSMGFASRDTKLQLCGGERGDDCIAYSPCVVRGATQRGEKLKKIYLQVLKSRGSGTKAPVQQGES